MTRVSLLLQVTNLDDAGAPAKGGLGCLDGAGCVGRKKEQVPLV